MIRLGSRKAIGLCALMALDGTKTREQLAALLWPDFDSSVARRNLRRDLFRLRATGLPIQERPDGALTCAVSPMLHDETQTGVPLHGLDGLAGEDFDAWLARARATLDAERSARWRESASEAARRGDETEALRQLEALQRVDPCDEAAALQAIALLRKRGDPVRAASWGRLVAQALHRQLGLPASAALREALSGVGALPDGPTGLLHGVGANPRVDAHDDLIPVRVPYIARVFEQTQVQAAWARGARVYLSGSPGAGKTRLAHEMAALQGGWLRLACEPNDTLVPYASAVRALRALREAAPDVTLVPWVLRELAQLLPELGPAPAVRESDESRARLIAAFAAAFAALVADNFKALVFDDWQWVDVASLDLWAMAEPPPGVAVLVAYRSAQLPAAALRQQRIEVDNGRAVHLALGGLDVAQTLALVRALSGSPGGLLLSQRLQRSTDGNPFFLLETLRYLQHQGLLRSDPKGGWATPFDEAPGDDRELPIPSTVRDTVRLRVRALGEGPVRLLEAASLVAGPFELGLLRDVTTLDEHGVLAALEHAAAAQLVVEQGSGWRFAHDLVRQCLDEGLGTARRRTLHRRLADGLERVAGSDALVAFHRERAGDAEAAQRGYAAAARAALRVHALGQALTHWADALRCGAEGERAVAIHLSCAQVHLRRSDPQAAQAALDAAEAVADGGPTAWRVQVQLARADLWAPGRTSEALSLLDGVQALDAHLPAPLRAKALQVRSRAMMYADRLAESNALLERAVAMLANLPDHAVERADMLDTLARARLRAGDIVGAATAAGEAVALLEMSDEPARLAYALTLRGVAMVHTGANEPARESFLRAREVARRCGEVPAQRGAIRNLVKFATDAGDVAAASALLDEGEALSPTFEHLRAELAFLEARFYVDYLRGDLQVARISAQRLIETADRVTAFGEPVVARHLVVDLLLLDGDLASARELLERSEALCDALRSSSGGGHYLNQQSTKMAWLLWAEGRPADALARLGSAPPTERVEDGIAQAWVGAAAALDLGDPSGAREWLERGVPRDDAPTDQLAMWLVQRLRLARVASGADDMTHRERARVLADSGRLPAQMATRLRDALSP